MSVTGAAMIPILPMCLITMFEASHNVAVRPRLMRLLFAQALVAGLNYYSVAHLGSYTNVLSDKYLKGLSDEQIRNFRHYYAGYTDGQNR